MRVGPEKDTGEIHGGQDLYTGEMQGRGEKPDADETHEGREGT